MTFHAPTGEEKVENKYATHRYFSAIAYGKIMKNKLVYKDKYTGHISKTKYTYTISGRKTKSYANLVYEASANDKILVRSAGSSKTKWYNSSSVFTKKINSENASLVINF